MNYEIEQIRLQRKAVKQTLEELEKREQEIYSHNRDADIINANELLIKDDVSPEQVNYIMGQSNGYVDGYKSAINDIVYALSDEYRDIPMTEHELYMLTALGETKERAWLKDYKQRQILQKNGWEQDYKDFTCPIWVKKPKEDEVSE